MRENRLAREARESQTKLRLREEKPIETRDLRERVRDREQRGMRTKRDSSRDRIQRETTKSVNKDAKLSITRRIGSRVIVAPTKPECEDDNIEVPVNSVVKVQPRPLIPKSKQACKNLLLRAVAEAQKSTALVKPPQREFKTVDRNKQAGELFTKAYRKNLQKDNIVVEIETNRRDGIIEVDDDTDVAVDDDTIEEEEEEEVEVEEEYVPETTIRNYKAPVPVNEDDSFVYIPKAIHNDG